MRMRRLLMAVVAISMTAGLAVVPRSAESSKKPKDEPTWAHPDIEKFEVDRIGMLPVATFDNNLDTERIVQNHVAMSLKDTGYRWLSGTAARALMKIGKDGEALSKAAREDILEDARIDSVMASKICAKLRIDAVLTVRVDRWEKREIASNESGKPTTTVYMKAALVDSSGTLLWRASGAEVVEGLYRQSRSSDGVGGSVTGLGVKAVTGAGGAPSYNQALEQLLIPWVASFPRKVERRKAMIKAKVDTRVESAEEPEPEPEPDFEPEADPDPDPDPEPDPDPPGLECLSAPCPF